VQKIGKAERTDLVNPLFMGSWLYHNNQTPMQLTKLSGQAGCICQLAFFLLPRGVGEASQRKTF